MGEVCNGVNNVRTLKIIISTAKPHLALDLISDNRLHGVNRPSILIWSWCFFPSLAGTVRRPEVRGKQRPRRRRREGKYGLECSALHVYTPVRGYSRRGKW